MPDATLGNVKKPSTSSLRAKSSFGRPGSAHGSICIPDRASSLKSASTHHIASQTIQPLVSQATRLVHAYMVCGLSRDPVDWTFSPLPSNTKTSRAHGSIGASISPSILGSIPPHDQDASTAQMFSSAMKAAFPNEAEIVSGAKAPDSTCHGFVLQTQSSQAMYGVTLRLWVRIDERRRAKIMETLTPRAAGLIGNGQTTWMPYCLTYLSHYPLFDLMSDYLRCSWMLYGKTPDKFNSDGVLPLTRVPPPKPGQFLRISLERYTFCYKLPSDHKKFQNFALWPIFCCLTTQQIVAVIEAALSPQGRIIFTSQHPAILTTVAESVRHYVKTWAGLYVPVVYSKEAQQHIDEPAPYILGVTKQSRSLFAAPRDALLVDLDFQRIFTSRPPGSLSPRQRKKYAAMLSKVLGTCKADGVPRHLRSAYDQKNQFHAVGAIIAADTSVPAVKDPSWWDPVQTAIVMSHITRRVRQNYKLLAALGSVKQRSTKFTTRDVTEMVHDRNFLARSVDDAWQAYIRLKTKSDAKILDLLKRETSLETDLASHKKEYTELSECTEALIEETRQLQGKVNQQMRDNVGLSSQLRDKTVHAKQLSNHVSELQSELKEANRTLSAQQDLLNEIEKSRNYNRDSLSETEDQCLLLTEERDEAHRAVIHLTSLISSQISYIERVISSLVVQPARPSSAQDNRKSVRRSFQSLTSSSPGLSPILSQFPLLKPGHDAAADSRRHTTDFSLSVLNPLSAAITAHAASRLQSSRPEPEEEPSMKEKVGAVSATVRKINEQCRAVIKDLADKRTEIHARSSPPTTAKSQDLERKLSAGAMRSSSAPPPTIVPNAISRLIENSRRELRGGDHMSTAGSQISAATKTTLATSVASSVPSLTSTAPTVLSDATDEPRTVSSPQLSEPNSAITIQSIAEEDDVVSGEQPPDTQLGPKSVLRRSSGVLGRPLFS